MYSLRRALNEPQVYRMKLKKPQICIRVLAICALLLFLGLPLTAQRFSAGIVGGLNASQIDGDMLAGFDKVGLMGGITAKVNFESRFAMNIEFLYTQRGSKPDIFSPEYDPNINIFLHYAELPVYVSLGDWWQEEGEYYKVSAHAGLSYGRLISARTVDYFHPSESSYDLLVPYFNQNDLSWLVGVAYQINSHFGFSGRYTREIIPLLSPKKNNLLNERLTSYYLTLRLEYYF